MANLKRSLSSFSRKKTVHGRSRLLVFLSLFVFVFVFAQPHALWAQGGGGDVQLLVSPTSLTFDYVVGGPLPASQAVSVNSSASLIPVTFTAGASEPWVTVAPSGGTTPQNLQVGVGVNVSGLAPGTYNATLTISATSPTVSNPPQQVVITLHVIGSLSVSPASLTFNYVIGGTVPAPQGVNVTGSATLNFSAVPSTGWITASPASGSTPASLQVGVNPSGLTAGTYVGSVSVSASASNSPQNVSVTLNVTQQSQPTLAVTPAQLNFVHVLGSPQPPQAQTLSVQGSASLAFGSSISDSWINLAPSSGSTPSALQVGVNPSGLGAGVYTGSITISAGAAANSPQSVSVVLTVIGPTTNLLSASPSALTFNYVYGSTPLPAFQDLSISATNALGFTLGKSASWITLPAVSGITNTTVQVGVNPTALIPGTYSASVTIAASGAANSPLTVPVTLIVSLPPSAKLLVNPKTLNFTHVAGLSPPPAPQTVTILAGSPTAYSASASTSWVKLSSSSGVTPGAVEVGVDPAGLTPGVYTASLTIAGPVSGSEQVVDVKLTVTAAPSSLMSVSPSQLTFTYVIGSGQAPPAQSFGVSASSSLSFTTLTPAAWISLNTSGGTAPAAISVSVDPSGLIVGRYESSITVTSGASNSPQNVRVVLYVIPSGGSLLTLSPPVLTFNYTIGGTLPQAQTMGVSGTAGLAFSASASTGWVAINPVSGAVPASLQVGVSPAGLNPGVYFSTLTIHAPNAYDDPQTAFVILNVNPSSGSLLSVVPDTLRFTYVVNSSQFPAAQSALVSGTVGINFAASASAQWLSLDTTSGITPQYLGVAVNPAGLGVGVYNASITVTSSTPAASRTISVILNVTPTPGPSLTVSPTVLTFVHVTGLPDPPAKNIQINGSVPLNFTLSSSAAWLKVDTTGGTTPSTVSVAVDVRGLNRGVYEGTITISAPSASNAPQTVLVRLLVNPELLIEPKALIFNHTIGATPPPSQTIFVSGAEQLSVRRSVSDPWIVTGDDGENVRVSVNPEGLPVGVYNGSVVIDAIGAAESPQAVLVTLVVNSSAPTLTVGPSVLDFRYVVGGANPGAQALAVNTSGHQPAGFSAGASAAWILPDISRGLTPAIVQVGVNPSGLGPGVYEGLVEVRAPGIQNAPISSRVRLTVVAATASPVLVSPDALIFIYNPGTPNPPAQTLLLTSTPSTNFTVATSTSWLSLSGSGGSTPGSVSVSVNAQSLAEGTYSGSVDVASGGVTRSVPVTLVVRAAVSEFRISPDLLVFEHSVGSTPPPLETVLFTANVPASASLSITTESGGNWLLSNQTGINTPAAVQVSVNPATLQPGVYQGRISVLATGVPNPARSVAVVLIVRGANEIAISPTQFEFEQLIGGPPPTSQPLTVRTGIASSFETRLITPSGEQWLAIDPSSGPTPGTAQVSVNGSGLSQGLHPGLILVTATNALNPRAVSVAFSLKPAGIVLTPEALDFRYQIGGPVPAARTLTVSTGVPASFTTTTAATGNWLTVTAIPGTSPPARSIAVNPSGLQPGIYRGTIVIEAPTLNVARAVDVTLTVVSPDIVASPSPITFEYLIGAATPGPVSVSLTSVAPVGFTATASTSIGGNWLTLGTPSGTTPATLTVGITPANLPPGIYRGTVVLRSAAADARIFNIPVELRVRDLAILAVGLPDTTSPAQQLPFGLQSSSPPAQAISGSLLLQFTPDVATPCTGSVCDEMVQFSGGGRSLPFTIPANQTTATFPLPNPQVLTGTTAGTITLVAQVVNGPAIALRTIAINRSAPRIVRLEVVRTTDGFEARVTGYSTSRLVSSVVFRFESRSGSNLQTTELQISPTVFDSWFRNADSAPLGGQFYYVQSFRITGDANAIASVSVAIGNDQGTTTSGSVPFPQ